MGQELQQLGSLSSWGQACQVPPLVLASHGGMQVVLGTWRPDSRCTVRGAPCARPGLHPAAISATEAMQQGHAFVWWGQPA